jgi:hypothetical protein
MEQLVPRIDQFFHQKTERHDGDGCANPGEKCPLIGGVICKILDHGQPLPSTEAQPRMPMVTSSCQRACRSSVSSPWLSDARSATSPSKMRAICSHQLRLVRRRRKLLATRSGPMSKASHVIEDLIRKGRDYCKHALCAVRCTARRLRFRSRAKADRATPLNTTRRT